MPKNPSQDAPASSKQLTPGVVSKQPECRQFCNSSVTYRRVAEQAGAAGLIEARDDLFNRGALRRRRRTRSRVAEVKQPEYLLVGADPQRS